LRQKEDHNQRIQLISVHDNGTAGALGELSRFRLKFYQAVSARADTLFELTDAVLCAERPVTNLAELSLVAEHRRGHGALHDAVNHGRIEVNRLRATFTGLRLPRAADGRLALAVDVSPWLRPDAATSAQRLFCHTYGRSHGQAQMIPGRPYSFMAALETGRTSWTAMLDIQRLGPADDATAVTATQLRSVVDRLITAIHCGGLRAGDPDRDRRRLRHHPAGFRAGRPPGHPAGTTVQRPGPTAAGTASPARHERPPTQARWRIRPDPPRHLATTPQHTSHTPTTHYGTAIASSWDRLHPRLTHRTSWLAHAGELPIIAGTLIRLQVDHLPGDRDAKPVWLWCSATDATPDDVDRWWQAFLRHFDIEHTLCATRRLVISPAQRGGNRKEVPGSDGLPGTERLRGQQHARKPVAGSRRMGRRTGGPARYGESLTA
jgi:hypothetical protein